MSVSEQAATGAGHESYGLPEKRAAGLCLAVLLLSATLHATSITTFGESQLQNSKRPASREVALDETKVATTPAATDMALMLHPNTEAAVQPSTVCILSSACPTSLEVPEPQSLVLVGSGLLSAAGLIRRLL